MTPELKQQGDPRASGNGQIFDTYPVATVASRNFCERMMKGEKMKANWVSATDFEDGPIDVTAED